MTGATPAGAYAPGGQDRLRTLVVAALGVVFGDIGTSPLYALRECFNETSLKVTEGSVLGVLSLIVWSQVLLITIKYTAFMMRADNQGQGGILALMALAMRGAEGGRASKILIALGAVGAALFFGDGMITPAISVLSAVEGLQVAAPWLEPAVVPVTLAVIVGLFAVQSHGTEAVGRLFGPVMVIWFVVLAALGLWQMLGRPEVVLALDPRRAVYFFLENRWIGFVTLGAVFLAVTGAEALYADIGHFGRRPITLAWLWLVSPALTLNYFGQGALLLNDPEAARNPFYLMAPGWALYPLIALATAAAVIASQAVISGAFSLASQAVQLGFLPRFEVRHTSEHEIGQIYVPRINLMLMIGVIVLVAGFRSSSALAAAYGIAVSATMLIDGILFWFVARRLWRWGALPTTLLVATFVGVDFAFLAANALKLFDGGWFPVLVGFGIVMVMMTWREGRRIVGTQLREAALPCADFLARLNGSGPARVAGTAVFLTGSRDGVPYALLHNLKHNKVLHERVVLLTVRTLDVPFVAEAERARIEDLGKGFWRVTLNYGFKQTPDVPRALASCSEAGGKFDLMQTSFFLGRERLVPKVSPLMTRWRERLYIAMQRSQTSATDFFQIPPNRVVELGTQIEI